MRADELGHPGREHRAFSRRAVRRVPVQSGGQGVPPVRVNAADS
ncbi:MAG TPA: hypothetical protein VN408_12025 [Actinoplanes sp.]|nr:hypothetical protein [Actinoplanes sp.]